MLGFVGPSPFLSIALRFAMETVHFVIAQISFSGLMFCNLGGPNEQYDTHGKWLQGLQGRSN